MFISNSKVIELKENDIDSSNNLIKEIKSGKINGYIVYTKTDHLNIVKFTFLGGIFLKLATLIGCKVRFINWASKAQVISSNAAIETIQKMQEAVKVLPKKDKTHLPIPPSPITPPVNPNLLTVSIPNFSPEKTGKTTPEEFIAMMNDKSVSNLELYQFMNNNQLTPSHSFFIKNLVPTDLAHDFAKVKGQTIQNFMLLHRISEAKIVWNYNIQNKIKTAGFENNELLHKLIKEEWLPDFDLYKFMEEMKISPQDGSWFEKEQRIRGLDANSFYKINYLIDQNAIWNKNKLDLNKKQQDNDNILKIILNQDFITDDDLYNFIQAVGVTAQDPCFFQGQPVDFDQPTPLKLQFEKIRPQLWEKMFSKVQEAVKAAKIAKSAKAAIINPLEHMISINCHGSFTNTTFKLPDDVYVLLPHPDGLKTPYILELPAHSSIEEIIYNLKDEQLPIPTSGAWHVYKPGQIINNLMLSPWSGQHDTSKEYNVWSQTVPSQDLKGIKDDVGQIPKFAVVPVRIGTKILTYQGKEKKKVKVFGYTDLKEIISELKKNNTGPIVVAPFACNAGKSYNEKVSCHKLSFGLVDIKPLFK